MAAAKKVTKLLVICMKCEAELPQKMSTASEARNCEE